MSDEPYDSEQDFDDVDEPRHEDRSSGWPKSLRRVLGSLTGSDDPGRGMFGELKLPKEALQFLAQQTEKSRRELFRLMANEFKSAVGRTNMLSDLRHALLGLKVQVKADITFTRDEHKTKVRTKVVTRKNKDKKATAAKEAQAEVSRDEPETAQQQNNAASAADSTKSVSRT